MMADFKEKFKTLFERIKKVKHIHIYLAIGLGVLIVACYLFSLPKKTENNKTNIDNNRTEFSSSAEYAEYLENKLENVITSIKGVGQAEVVVSLEKGFEYIYQTEEETRSTSNGTSITTTSVVMINGQPVIKEEIYPIIKGIVVVADGCGDVATRMDVLNLIQTVVEVQSSQIKIMEGK